jgi:hypothetical protein
MTRDELIISMRESGVGPRQIARSLGLTPSLVSGVLYRAGLTRDIPGQGLKYAANAWFRRAVVEAARSGTITEASLKYGVSRGSVRRWMAGA